VATNIRVFRPEPRNLEESITAQSHLLDNVNQNKDQEIENFFNMDLNGPSPKDEKTNFQPNESGQKTYITKIPNNLASNKKARYKTGFNDNWIDPNSQCYKDWVEKLENEPKKFKDLACGKVYDCEYLNEHEQKKDHIKKI